MNREKDLDPEDFARGDEAFEASEKLRQYLEALAKHPDVRGYKIKSILRLQLNEGENVLDLGCGPGVDSERLALRVGDNGRIVGVDNTLSHLLVAKANAPTDVPIYYVKANADRLPFPSDTFHGVRADRVLQHIPDPQNEKALAELVRVTRTGRQVVVSEPDWSQLKITGSHYPRITEHIASGYVDLRPVPHPDIGGRLEERFKKVGMDDICVTTAQITVKSLREANDHFRLSLMADRRVEHGTLPLDMRNLWLADLDAQSKEFSVSVPIYIVSGRTSKTNVR